MQTCEKLRCKHVFMYVLGEPHTQGEIRISIRGLCFLTVLFRETLTQENSFIIHDENFPEDPLTLQWKTSRQFGL